MAQWLKNIFRKKTHLEVVLEVMDNLKIKPRLSGDLEKEERYALNAIIYDQLPDFVKYSKIIFDSVNRYLSELVKHLNHATVKALISNYDHRKRLIDLALENYRLERMEIKWASDLEREELTRKHYE